MRFPLNSKFALFLIVAGALLLLSVSSSYLGMNKTLEKNSPPATSTPATQSKTAGSDSTTTSSTGNNSVKIGIDNSVQTNQSNSSNQGTCTVTKNGVTTTVPANQVNIDEKSGGDVNVKVACNTSSNSTNEAGIKNDVNVNVNTSN